MAIGGGTGAEDIGLGTGLVGVIVFTEAHNAERCRCIGRWSLFRGTSGIVLDVRAQGTLGGERRRDWCLGWN